MRSTAQIHRAFGPLSRRAAKYIRTFGGCYPPLAEEFGHFGPSRGDPLLSSGATAPSFSCHTGHPGPPGKKTQIRLVRIDAQESRSTEQIATLLEAVHRALVTAFPIPIRDRYPGSIARGRLAVEDTSSANSRPAAHSPATASRRRAAERLKAPTLPTHR
jgi:hypothetical protein